MRRNELRKVLSQTDKMLERAENYRRESRENRPEQERSRLIGAARALEKSAEEWIDVAKELSGNFT